MLAPRDRGSASPEAQPLETDYVPGPDEPGHRVGPADLWATFDQALEHFGTALAGDSLMAIAQAFGEIAQAATQIADAIEADAPTAATG